MKRRIIVCVLVLVLAFACVTPAFAAAADVGRGTALRVDSQSQYEGMDSTYQGGYSPQVINDSAHIILPLMAGAGTEQVKSGENINISVNLGDPSKAPFVFNNYNKTVSLQDNKLADGSKKKSYLVDFTLPLAADRVNGNYPVVFTAKYPITDGTVKTQEFTVFVKITDGAGPSAPPSEPTVTPTAEPTAVPTDVPIDPGTGGGTGGGGGGTSGTASQPKVIISKYTISPDMVNAGEKFTVNVTLQNTSKTQSVKNIVVNFKSQTTDLMSGDNTNMVYIEKIAAKKTSDFSFTMMSRADAKAGPQKMDVAITYEDAQAAQLTAADEISVEIHQKIRLEFDPPKFPTQVVMGDTTSASLNLYNKGKSTLYNVTVTLDVPGFTPESSAFLGNMESGASKTADIYASVAADPNAGMNAGGSGDNAAAAGGGEGATGMAMAAGNEDNAKDAATAKTGEEPGAEPKAEAKDSDITPGPIEGNFIIAYEDEYGEKYEIKVPVKTELMPMQSAGGDTTTEEQQPQAAAGFPIWAWFVIAGVAAAVVITVVVKKKKKARLAELAEEIDDDDIY
ncbi:MAG: hypothetical protein RR514_03680 [Christensenella sp.]